MNNYILYYYLREDFSSPFYVGYGRPRRINSRHSRRNGAEILPPRERRWIVQSGLSKRKSSRVGNKTHSTLEKRVWWWSFIKPKSWGEGKPGGQKTKGFSGRTHTEEAKRKISEKVAGKNNPSYGVPCSEERKRK